MTMTLSKERNVIEEANGQILVKVPSQQRFINIEHICFPDKLPGDIIAELKQIKK